MTQIEFLTNTIKSSKPGHPIYVKRLAEQITEKYSLDRKRANTAAAVSVKRILDRKIIPELRCYQKGIYYLSKATPFGDTPIDSNLLIFDKYIADGNGYESGLGELHVLGLVSQMPRQRVIVSNTANSSWNNDVIIKPPKTTVTNDNKAYLQILDAIAIMDKAPIDIDDPYRIVLDYIETTGLDFARLLGMAYDLYSKEVVLRLGRIASARLD